MNFTREVVADLWPLYVDGHVSPETRALVEEFLRSDPEWNRSLQRAGGTASALPVPAVRPDQEVAMLNRIKKRISFVRWMLFGAMAASLQAFGRIIADTSWDVSPKAFLWWVCLAAGFWGTWIVSSLRLRRLGP